MKTRHYLARNIRGHWLKASLAAVLALAAALCAASFAQTSADSSGGLAAFAAGSKEIDLAQYTEAIEHLKTAAKAVPQLSDYGLYLRAEAEFALQHYAEIEKLTRPVWERKPASPLAAKAVLLYANALLLQNKSLELIHLLEKHPATLQPAEAASLLGHAWEREGEAAKAIAEFERIFTLYPLSPQADDAEAELARLSPPGPKTRLARALKLAEAGDTARAHAEFEALIPLLPEADRELAFLKSSETDYELKHYAAACSALKDLSFKSPDLSAERLYDLVRCAVKLQRPAEFEPHLSQLAQAHAQSPWRLRALSLAAGDYWAQNQPSAYVPLYRSCEEEFPRDAIAQTCFWRVVWAGYLARAQNSAQQFQAFIERYPASDQTPDALYFLGRTAESAQKLGLARAYYGAIDAHYPNSFFAILARNRMAASAAAGEEIPDWLRTVRLPSPRAAPDWVPAGDAAVRIERARLLENANLSGMAEDELRFGAKVDGQPDVEALELAAMAGRRGAPHAAIRYIKQLAPGYLRITLNSSSERLWKLAFPLPFRDEIEQFSRNSALDPFLVAALVRQESEFDPDVVSHSQAYGLTQILPSTGREIGRKLNLLLDPDSLFNPEVNLRIGTYFFRSLLDRVQGKWEAALAAYNAGPARVAKWLSWTDFREPAEFIETIPFDETRTYVQAVLRNAEIYRRLYGGKTVAELPKPNQEALGK